MCGWMVNSFIRAEVVPLYIKSYRPTPAMGRMRDYVLRRISHQSFLEGVVLSLSGGHAVIRRSDKITTEKNAVDTRALESDGDIIGLHKWTQSLHRLEFDRSGVVYRAGFDWWAMGDHEQEHQYHLVDRSWHFSNQFSGITRERALENYALKIEMDVAGKPEQGRLGQQYFMRVWDANPKTIAVRAQAGEDLEIEACLELRGLAMSTAEARVSPEVHCLGRLAVKKGNWQELQFNFEPPPRADYRGMRFRFDVYSASENTVYLDDIRFISWERSGISTAGQILQLPDHNRLNMVDLTGAKADPNCCTATLIIRQ